MTSTQGASLIFAQGHNSDIEEHVRDCLGSQELPLYRKKVVIFENLNEINLKLMQTLSWRECLGTSVFKITEIQIHVINLCGIQPLKPTILQ